MSIKQDRVPGTALTSLEKDLLVRLCSGDWKGSREAAQQAQVAQWGGREFTECECFLISVPRDATVSDGTLSGGSVLGLDVPGGSLPLVPKHSGGPFSSIEVFDGGECIGHLNLWVEDGLLHSLDFMTFGEPDEVLPQLENLGPTPFKP